MIKARFALIAICIGLFTVAAAYAHSFYSALTRINYNDRAGTIEVIHRLAAHDLEAVLSFQEERHILFEETFKEAEALTGKYLQDHFTLQADDAFLDLRYLGTEIKGDEAFAYFEAPMKHVPKALLIKNEIFLDDLPQQRNTVVATFHDLRFAEYFHGKQRTHVFDLQQ